MAALQEHQQACYSTSRRIYKLESSQKYSRSGSAIKILFFAIYIYYQLVLNSSNKFILASYLGGTAIQFMMKRFILPLVLAATVVMAGVPGALPTLGTKITAKPTSPGMELPVNHTLNGETAIQRRVPYAQQAQKPLNGCPGMFGSPVLDCSVCGGESPTRPGECSQPLLYYGGWRCACSPNMPTPGTTTVVMATVGSAIATGTFELETLTQYASLREHITIMTTTVGTATSTGDSSIETVAAVVLVGGVAWFLAGFAGDAAAAAALQPPDKSPNRDDDKTCPDPKNKCNDCGGISGMCTSGSNSGCGCEEASCPVDGAEDQPACSDEAKCSGKDGQCTLGEHEGCECKKDEVECPDRFEVTFWCDMHCGGKDEDGKCKGDPKEDYLFKGCECTDDPDWSSQAPPLRRLDFGKFGYLWANIPDITYAAAKPSPTALPHTECNSTQESEVPWNVFSPGVYTNFCASLDEMDRSKSFSQYVGSRGDVVADPTNRKRQLLTRTPPPNPATYLFYTFELSWSGGDNSCPSNCSNSFYTMTESPCGHTASEQNIMASEAKLDTGCGTYSYKIIGPPKTPDLPTNMAPTTVDGWLCSDPLISIGHKFTLKNAEDAVSKFCVGDMNVPAAGQPVSNTYDYKDLSLLLQVKWRSVGQDGCGRITNSDGSMASTITKQECSTHLLSAVNNCDTNTRTNKLGGTYTWSSPIGCIEFSVHGQDLGADMDDGKNGGKQT